VVTEKSDEGLYRLHFEGRGDVLSELDDLGETPLPPYIVRPPGPSRLTDRERYQTVYAQVKGSVAAPTAGLHFSEALLERLHQRGVSTAFVTLHVGHATFAPVKTPRIADHTLHAERFMLSAESAEEINRAKAEGRRVIAVGTTTLRVLEHVSGETQGRLDPMVGCTRLFVFPPHRFHTVDALITNFHLPRSSLLMLVSAFADPDGLRGRERILRAYAEAIQGGYRFFSYGDAMLIEASAGSL
jgi:S-adenosylmethionine:tRNA ribosyltransferase-isomerase